MIRNAAKTLNSWADIASMAFLAVAAIIVFMQVVFRYVLRMGFAWTEELARYMIVYCCMVGASVVVRDDGHPKIEILTELLPSGVRRALEMALDLVVLFFLAVMTWQGIDSTIFGLTTRTAGLHMPWAVAYAAIPISGVLMAVQVLCRILGR